MFDIWKKWYLQLFGKEEALLLLLLLIAGLIIIVTLGDVLAPVIASLVLAFLLQGLNERLESWRVPRLVALWVTFLLFVGGFFVAILFLLPVLWGQLETLFNELPRMVETVRKQLLTFQQQHPELLSEAQLSSWTRDLANEVSKLGQWAVPYFISSIPNLVGLMIYAILMPILIFFFLKDRQQLLTWAATFLPEERPLMRRIWLEMNDQVANYVRGKAIEIMVVGVVSYVVFVWLGLNYAALLASLVGLSVVIPFIGAAVVTIPVALVAFFQWGWSGDFMWLMIAYFVVQALDGNVLVPLLFSEAVNLHPVAIILAVLVFGGFWGMWGVFFAIPLATLIMALINAWPRYQVLHQE